MRDRLKAIWRLTGDMYIMDIGHGFFMVKFDLEPDREKVISGGPWMIVDHYVSYHHRLRLTKRWYGSVSLA
jgi:hypothetical protein